MVLLAVLIPLGVAIGHRDGSIFQSPAYLLAAVVIVFYSIIPYLIEIFYIADLIAARNTGSLLFHPIVTYFGSTAEALVITFSAILIVLHLGIVTRLEITPPARIPSSTLAHRIVILLAVLMAVGLLFISMFNERTGPLYDFISTYYAPIQSVVLIYLIHHHKTSERQSLMRLGAYAAICILPLALLGCGKIPVFMSVSAIVYYLSFDLPSTKQFFTIAIAGLLIFFTFVPLSLVLRENEASMTDVTNTLNKIQHAIVMKAFGRQTSSGYCFKNVIERHWDTPFRAGEQLFWLEGLVPRALWPEKESLSHGADYSFEYCDRELYAPVKNSHSSSITVLGQPIIKGGSTGLFLHGGILVFFLGGLTWIARRSNGLGRIFVFALLPWWIDFDQDYVLYTANLAKFALVMASGVFAAYLLSSRLSDRG